MEIVVREKTSEAFGDFGRASVQLTLKLEGRKSWKGVNELRFETSDFNLRLLRSLFPEATERDERATGVAASLFEAAVGPGYGAAPGGRPSPTAGAGARFRMEPFPFQLVNFEEFKDKLVWAIFSEPGTGKTKTGFDIISHRFERDVITGVLIFSIPKGVHAQWIDQQMPKHLWEGIETKAAVWSRKWLKRGCPDWLGWNEPGKLHVLSANIDAVLSAVTVEKVKKTKVITPKDDHPIVRFIRAHAGKLLIIIDEADCIRNHQSSRWLALDAITAGEPQRGVMTGTPIAKDLTDEWSIFKWLDPSIIGHKYLTTFKAQFCVMGGYEDREVVDHKNIDLFKSITAPHIFRATKAELNLKGKIYDEIVFDLSDEQERHKKALKAEFMTALQTGEVTSVTNAASLLIRLQQLSCGYLVDEEGKVHDLAANPRMEAHATLRHDLDGKVITWCRFNHDIELLKKQLGDRAVIYYGPSSTTKREEALRLFTQDRQVTDLIASPAAMGRGVDGLQHVSSREIFYSNSFNAIDRWQAEDRLDRTGQTEFVGIFDIVGRGTIDRSILRNLRGKKSLSDLVLDDIVEMIEEL